MMPERRVQVFGPVLVGGVDEIRGADHADSSIDSRVEDTVDASVNKA